MFSSKRTVKQVLAPFSQMIKELDESAKEAQTKLLEISKSTPQVDSRESFLPEVLRAGGQPA